MNCHDCGAELGQLHKPGCDTEHCAMCGRQLISCDCVYEVSGIRPEPGDGIYENGPTEKMWAKFDAEIEKLGGRLPWTGRWPGVVECEEFGWFSRWVDGSGWVRCERDHPDAGPDLNRLATHARWDKDKRRWTLPDGSPEGRAADNLRTMASQYPRLALMLARGQPKRDAAGTSCGEVSMSNDSSKLDPEQGKRLVEFFRSAWKNAGTVCHLCGQPGMKELGEAECRPHDCLHGSKCQRSPLAPPGHTTSCCSQCNSSTRFGDLLAEAMRGPRKQGE